MNDSKSSSNSNDKHSVRTATAYHEAGHAVMALIVDRPIQKITISPGNMEAGGVRLGVCELKKGKGRSTRDWIEDEVLIFLAGMVAESHYTGKYCPSGAMQDLLIVKRLLEDRAGSERKLEKLQRRLLDKCEYLLSDPKHAAAIELIANELIEKTKISGRAASHLFRQAVGA